MKLLRVTALASFVVAAVAVGAGTSYAQPAQPAQPPAGIQYEVKLLDQTVVTNLDGGHFDVAADQRSVDIEDEAGNTVLTLPLSFALDGVEHPYAVALSDDNSVLELTPDLDPAKASPSLLKPTASLVENQRAQESFATQFGIATAIGSFTGLVVGAVAGGVIGCALGLPLLGVGCIPAAIAGSSIGGVIGTIAVGGPALAIAGVDLVQTLTAPPGTTKWNY